MTENISDDQYAGFREAARTLVVAEVEDVLTRDADMPPGEQYATVAHAIAQLHPQDVLSVLVETAAVAGEAVIRLAAARGEDPRKTWEWLMSTPWTGVEGVPEDGPGSR
jgi:hypothetical protein